MDANILKFVVEKNLENTIFLKSQLLLNIFLNLQNNKFDNRYNVEFFTVYQLHDLSSYHHPAYLYPILVNSANDIIVISLYGTKNFSIEICSAYYYFSNDHYKKTDNKKKLEFLEKLNTYDINLLEYNILNKLDGGDIQTLLTNILKLKK